MMWRALVWWSMLVSRLVNGESWDYDEQDLQHGPAEWKKDYPACGGSSQSPINIVSSQAFYDPSLTPFIFNKYNPFVSLSLNLINDGHTAKVTLSPGMTVDGGGLPAEYYTNQFHFHWGTVNSKGSEHHIDGKEYPMEMHIVSFKTGEQNSSLALPDGVAVVGLVFEISCDENENYNEVFNYLQNVQDEGTVAVPSFHIEDLLPEKVVGGTHRYWRYKGSLTTPPCSEAVIWSVFQEPVLISQRQLELFRSLQNTRGLIEDNYRPLQPLNNRIVTTNFDPSLDVRDQIAESTEKCCCYPNS